MENNLLSSGALGAFFFATAATLVSDIHRIYRRAPIIASLRQAHSVPMLLREGQPETGTHDWRPGGSEEGQSTYRSERPQFRLKLMTGLGSRHQISWSPSNRGINISALRCHSNCNGRTDPGMLQNLVFRSNHLRQNGKRNLLRTHRSQMHPDGRA